jgi:hypothetical protein
MVFKKRRQYVYMYIFLRPQKPAMPASPYQAVYSPNCLEPQNSQIPMPDPKAGPLDSFRSYQEPLTLYP